MAKNDTVVLYHPGGTRIELDAAHKTRVEQFKARGYTSEAPKPSTQPQTPAQK